MENIEIAKKLIKYFNDSGYNLYLVGGSVRDYLINNNFDDFDFSTPETPNITKKMLNLDYLNQFSEKFGTINGIYENKNVQITTFRKDIYENNNRHPKITFIKNMKEDSLRRDFTINALYMDNTTIYDFHNGISDLNNKILKSIKNPILSYSEDPLRIIRIIRFSLILKFKINEDDLRAIKQCKDKLKILSKEKINQEIDKTTKHISKNELIDAFKKIDIFDYIKDKMI